MNELSSYDASLVDARWVVDRFPVAHLGRNQLVALEPCTKSPHRSPEVSAGDASGYWTGKPRVGGGRATVHQLEILKRLREDWSAGVTGE